MNSHFALIWLILPAKKVWHSILSSFSSSLGAAFAGPEPIDLGATTPPPVEEVARQEEAVAGL